MAEHKFIRAYSAADDKTVILKRPPPFPLGVKTFNTEEEALNG